MKRIKVDALQPGYIVLTASKSAAGKGIRAATFARVSHSMICVQHGSVIDSTSEGVQARNVQRGLFKPAERVHAFRLRRPVEKARIDQIVNFARAEIGARYSVREAVRSGIARATASNSARAWLPAPTPTPASSWSPTRITARPTSSGRARS